MDENSVGVCLLKHSRKRRPGDLYSSISMLDSKWQKTRNLIHSTLICMRIPNGIIAYPCIKQKLVSWKHRLHLVALQIACTFYCIAKTVLYDTAVICCVISSLNLDSESISWNECRVLVGRVNFSLNSATFALMGSRLEGWYNTHGMFSYFWRVHVAFVTTKMTTKTMAFI